MKAKEFFEKESIPEAGFEKIPVGMVYIKTDSLDIEGQEKEIAGVKKQRYMLRFLNKKGEKKEYEVGVQIVRGIEKALPAGTEYLLLTRQGTGKEDTKYTVVPFTEN